MKKIAFLSLFLILLLLSGCAGEAAVSGTLPQPENRLVVYTSHKEEVYQPIIREFEERTGIWVELVTGGSYELLEQIEAEKAAPKADVMFGGGVESLESYRHLFQPIRCQDWEQISASLRQSEDLWTPFSALPLVLIYNPKLVDPSHLTGWQDLTREEFRGKIAFADPTKSASSFTALVTLLSACGEERQEEAALIIAERSLTPAQARRLVFGPEKGGPQSSRRRTVRAEQENRVKSTDGTAAVSVLANPAAAE